VKQKDNISGLCYNSPGMDCCQPLLLI